MSEQLPSATGRRYWRSLEELAGTEAFQELLEREFPTQASPWAEGTSRRQFLKLMGASLALAGLHGCARQPQERIVPYVRQPELIVPGEPLYFATATPVEGFALGVLVESHMGRPTKVEGNPEHPASLGATDVFAQAEVLGLYDPDRSQAVLYGGEIGTWNAALTSLRERLDAMRATQGAGLRILTETVTSPTLAHQLQTVLDRFPKAKWHQFEPVNRDNEVAGARLAFGDDVGVVYHFDRADVVLSLDADFLTTGPGRVRYARDFMSGRRVSGGRGSGAVEMNRLYVVESMPTPTGAVADHRLPVRASQVERVGREVAARLGVERAAPDAGSPDASAGSSSSEDGDAHGSTSQPAHLTQWLDAVVEDLKEYRRQDGQGAALVIAGRTQPPVVHALAHAMNHALGSVGTTVTYTEPVEAVPVLQNESLGELVDWMQAGRVEMLVILGGNPVFTAPSDVPFADALLQVPYRLHLSLYEDETSALCPWHIPATHFLESWGDARAFDGTATIIQPLIAPLYDNRSAHELLAALRDNAGATAHDLVRDYWRARVQVDDFDTFWQTALHDGLVPDTAAPEKPVSMQASFAAGEDRSQSAVPSTNPEASRRGDLEIVFRPDPTIWDGRYANNPWLQELPKPLTRLTWDNAALMSPATAERLQLTNEQVVELKRGTRALELPVWILPGHADDSVTVHLGYGRTRAGQVGTGTGFNAYQVRTREALWFASDVQLRRTDQRYSLAITSHHHLMDDRDVVRSGTIDEVRRNPQHPAFMSDVHEPNPEHTLYSNYEYNGYKWGMSINLQSCIGCNACVVACQAENNIPVVGKDEVIRGREMHWLRIDAYYEGRPENPQTHFQPVPCMHCENAPCEVVCPVAATVHSSEGLNQMVYNRCVGTRYCSNNCPYKVRRFNFLQFSDYETPVLKLGRNPDVTVRSRGVMEKCTYCVQRISAARIEAEKQDRTIRDGEVVTACQQACPSQAIVFGDLNDAESRVTKLQTDPLDYALLAELNTRPRTTYLAAVHNPHPKLEGI